MAATTPNLCTYFKVQYKSYKREEGKRFDSYSSPCYMVPSRRETSTRALVLKHLTPKHNRLQNMEVNSIFGSVPGASQTRHPLSMVRSVCGYIPS